jgi:alkaline phosphatase D
MSDPPFTRRSALGLATAAPTLLLTPQARADSGRHVSNAQTLTRIAFGSCAHQDKDQPIWEAIVEAKPDLFIFLGDNVYIDSANPTVMREAYERLAAKPGFQRLRSSTPILAVWDDHDFGANDAGREFSAREASRAVFCDFWGESAHSPRRTGGGIHIAHTFGQVGQRVQVILPDLRMGRARLRKRNPVMHARSLLHVVLPHSSREVAGPYLPSRDPKASMLDADQWAWLDACLQQPAEVRLLASSLQVVADFTGWEAWANFPRDRERLLTLLAQTGASGVICLSGDTHYGEVSCLPTGAPYPLWDFTSSGLTEVWEAAIPNRWRQGEAFAARNFGLLSIDWMREPLAGISVQVCDERGQVRLQTTVGLEALQSQPTTG